jgi:hypothetical protein
VPAGLYVAATLLTLGVVAPPHPVNAAADGALTRSPLRDACLCLAGFAQSLTMISIAVILMRTASEHFRVMGVRMLAIYGLPLGLLAAGGLIDGIGFAATGTLYAAGADACHRAACHHAAPARRSVAPASARECQITVLIRKLSGKFSQPNSS